MSQPPILNIKMVPAGIEIVRSALNQSTLPHAQVAPLLAEIVGQAQFQLQQIAEAEKAKQEKVKAPKQPRKKVKAVETPPADDPDPSDVLA